MLHLSKIANRPFLFLAFAFVVLLFLNVVSAGTAIPSFIQSKVEEALMTQPLTVSNDQPVPSINQYIRLSLQSRNDRYHGRSQNAYEAEVVFDEKGVHGYMRNVAGDVEYLYDNGRLVVNYDCITDPTVVAPLVQFQEFVQNLDEILHQQEIEVSYDKDLNEACKGMKKFGLVYADTPFVLCATDKDLKFIVSENVWISVLEWNVDKKYVEKKAGELPLKPTLFEHCMPPLANTQMKAIMPFSSVNGLAWFSDSRICKLPFLRDRGFCQKEKPIEPTKDCIFLHGVGESVTDVPVPTHPDYWGSIEDYTPQCKTRLFIRQETKKRGWTDPQLQEEYCKLALTGNKEGDKTIRNKILFVHSMGNLILGGAIMNNVCQIDKNTTSWYNIMGPLLGSAAADMLGDICDPENKKRNAIFHYVAEKGGYCIPGENKPYPAYGTLQTTYEGLNEKLWDVINNYTTGSMCGESPVGLVSPYSVLKILSMIVGYDSENDGMVTIKSCNPKSIKDYKPDYESTHYLGQINHADGTCRSGNSWIFGKTKSPCSYYTGKM